MSGRSLRSSQAEPIVSSNKATSAAKGKQQSSSSAVPASSSSSSRHATPHEANIAKDLETDHDILIEEHSQNIHAAIFQLLSANHIIEDSALSGYLEDIMTEWGKTNPTIASRKIPSLRELFTDMNRGLKLLGLEVRSVAFPRAHVIRALIDHATSTTGGASSSSSHRGRDISSSSAAAAPSIANDEEWMYFHGIINTDETDLIAKEFGSTLTPTELKAFASIAVEICKQGSLSSHDMHGLDSCKKIPEDGFFQLLSKLEAEQWLTRNERGHYILNVRSYLELRNYFDTILTTELEDLVEAGENQGKRDQIDRSRRELPSILFY